MASARLTKKCFEIMDRAEIRRIAMIGMGLPPKEAYCLDHKGIVSWVYSNAKGFADVDLGSIKTSKSGKESFRPGVVSYLQQLQLFIQKKADKPVWPPTVGVTTVEEVVQEAVEEVEEVEEVISTSEVATEEEALVEEPVKETAPVCVQFKKKPLKPKVYSKKKAKTAITEVEEAKASEPEAESSQDLSQILKQVSRTAERMDYVSKALSEIKQKSFERYDEQTDKVEVLSSRIDTLDKAVVQLSNALLFVINTVCLEDSVVTTLDDIPTPDNY